MLQRIFATAQAAALSIIGYVRGRIHKWGWKKTSIGAAVLVVLFLILNSLGGGPAEVIPTSDTRSVTLASVADLSNQSSGLSVSGVVSSKSEATVRAEKSGQVTAINYQLGDRVGAGAVVAQVENASERAAVLQAQAGVEAALASANISGSQLEGAKRSAVSTLLAAYAAVDNALSGTADQMFSNPAATPHTYHFRVRTGASEEERDAEKMRSALDAVLERQGEVSGSISVSTNLVAELERTEAELRQVRDFLNTLLVALNEGETDATISETTLQGYKTDAIAARAAVTASLAAVAGAKQAVQGAETTGGGGASAASATLKQAEAGLAAARANFEHTVVRAPISGTINSLSLKLGDYIQMGSPVLTVANNNALEVVAYVTEPDARGLAVGGKAVLKGGIEGVITRLAPAIDPLTKKIEVRIGLSANTTLTNGQSVTVELARAGEASAAAPARLIIPLAALKISADGMSVFTVDNNLALVPHTVVIGELLGDRVVITSGLTADMQIVTDARGLRAGQAVTIAK